VCVCVCITVYTLDLNEVLRRSRVVLPRCLEKILYKYNNKVFRNHLLIIIITIIIKYYKDDEEDEIVIKNAI